MHNKELPSSFLPDKFYYLKDGSSRKLHFFIIFVPMRFPKIKGFDEEAFEKYLKNTSWLMFGKMLSLVINLAIAKYLGPALFGDLSFAIALVAITGAIGALGLDTFIIREIINDPLKKDEVLGTSLWLRIGINTLLVPITLLIYLIYCHLSAQTGTTLTVFVVLLAFTSFFKSFNVIDSYFQSQVQSKYVVHVQNICLILSTLIKITILLLELPLLFIVLALFFEALILAIGLIIVYQCKAGNIIKWTFNKKRASSLLKQSSPLMLSAVMVSIYMKIDIVMLKTVGSIAVGTYAAAANISEAWYFMPVAIVTSVFPAIINARKTDLERYFKRLKNLYDLLVYISLPMAIVISFYADNIIHLIYAEKFNGAGFMLSIHIWSGLFVFLGSASSQYLISEGYMKISFYRTALGAIVNVFLNLWLIPLYAGVGASIATLIACFVSTFLILFIPKTRQQGIEMLKSLILISLFQKLIKR